MRLSFITSAFLIGLLSLQSNCSKGQKSNSGNSNSDNPGPPVSYWITKGDQSALLQKQVNLNFGTASNSYPFIDVDTTQTFQSIDGFGYALTDGSAYLINKLSASDKNSLLQELFGNNETSIGVSYLRISI